VLAVDTNILIYAHRKEMPLHQIARDKLKTLSEGQIPDSLGDTGLLSGRIL